MTLYSTFFFKQLKIEQKCSRQPLDSEDYMHDFEIFLWISDRIMVTMLVNPNGNQTHRFCPFS